MIENERKEPEDDQVVPDLNVSTEQEVPGIGDGNGPLPDLNVCFTGEVPALRHSPRIQKQYDGVRITSSDRATRRKEVANGDTVSISSQGSESSRGKRHKKKRLDVADLVQLPLKKKPAPTTKAKIKKVGRMLWN
uniref:Uncharacterized protein n=1 Tax=Arundo donax TaxID=35708 RepID=A0A0A9GML6_ARUDO